MGIYDLQNYLNYWSGELEKENTERMDLLNRANQAQGEYLYRKEASAEEDEEADGSSKEARPRLRPHKSTKQRPPRLDERKYVYKEKERDKSPHKFKKIKNKSLNNAKKSAIAMARISSNIDNGSDTFNFPAPRWVNLKDPLQKKSWEQALDKVASRGDLISEEGSLNYPSVISSFKIILKNSSAGFVDVSTGHIMDIDKYLAIRASRFSRG
jgi:hypothetical protein